MKADHMYCMDAERLLRWILHDLKHGSALGIVKQLFFVPKENDPFRMTRYGVELETPVGVAAGPHTQLAQNIIAAWLTGARYIELKTVQVLDELNVTKPCIDMRDEGYNCEWSQELKLEQSYDEYLKAWVLLHVLHDALGFPGKPGFIFNMSAGYDLKGIQSPTVQRFFDRMSDCRADVAALKAKLAPVYPRIKELDIPGRMSDSLTISCMHGCPPDEVERIALYFIEERRFHTTLKLNPTLLGKEQLRGILNDTLGYPTEVPDIAFGHDLVYSDAVSILKNCLAAAEKSGVAFGIKLTNTLETSNTHQNLPKNEGMVYMSGRALHPVSTHLAARLQKDFEGTLDISFSAGTDTFNIADVLACGLAPVTVCSDLLKPGGYGRLSQYMPMLVSRMRTCHASSLTELVLATGKTEGDVPTARVRNLESYAAQTVVPGNRYALHSCPPSIKTRRPLARFDCAAAPCMLHCPTEQHIPAYLERVAQNDSQGAWRIIMDTNPFPNVQGQVCNHKCQSRCTRVNYDAPLLIRDIKRYAAEACAHLRMAPLHLSDQASIHKVAIVGAGPSGLSCAHFLALAGCKVTVFEAKDRVGGMAADAIPAFRLSEEGLKRDVENILALGVDLRSGVTVDDSLFGQMEREYDAVYVAVGAQKSLPLGIPGEEAAGVLDQLHFLSAVRQGQKMELGQRVLVVGGGNSAMDVARTALRMGSKVTLVYRRTCAQMPCDREELEQALEEGVKLMELARPERVVVENGNVTGLEVCPMKLECVPCDATTGAGGARPRPVPCGEAHRVIPADTIIVSIGQRAAGDLSAVPAKLDELTAQAPAQWRRNILTGGDAARGAATLIEAIGDGRHAAGAILQRLGLQMPDSAPPHNHGDQRPCNAEALRVLRVKQARRNYGPGTPILPAQQRINFDLYVRTMDTPSAKAEAGRCLQCDLYCGICVTVCPNRANVALDTMPLAYTVQEAVQEEGHVRVATLAHGEISQPSQIINLGDFCNECGNCAAFCPTSGAPYKDKPRLHLSRVSYDAARDGYYFPEPGLMLGKQDGKNQTLRCQGGVAGGVFIYEDGDLHVEMKAAKLHALHVELKNGLQRASLAPAVEMALLYKLISDSASFLRTLA